jgi:uncharacterized membrane protein
MNRNLTLTTLSLAALSSLAAAQAPTFIPLSGVAQGVSTDCGIVVVGGSLGGQAYRWTPADGQVFIGGAGWSSAGNVSISRDGSMITATTTDASSIQRTSRWNGGTSWTQLAGLGAMSGNSETSSWGIDADGGMVVGLAWVTAGQAHAASWTSGGITDLGSTVANRSSRANRVSDDGTIVVGWQDRADGVRQGARWTNGVQSLFSWTDPSLGVLPLGEVMSLNGDASVLAGINQFNGDNQGWRWDASTGQITLLPNLPGQSSSNRAIPSGMNADGSVICGSNGGNPLTRRAIVWMNNQPNDLLDILNAQGTQGISGFTTLGSCNAISRDGRVIVGYGHCPGGPTDSWIVIFPETSASTVGTPYCFGDGSGSACPCGNSGSTGHGCANSTDSSGGVLTSTGVASVSSDTLQLLGTHMRATNCLYFQGTTQQANPINSGIECVGGSLVRLGVEVNGVAGNSSYPKTGSADLPISVKGMIPATGGTYQYQAWYRDNNATFCSGGTSNYTNGYAVTWTP